MVPPRTSRRRPCWRHRIRVTGARTHRPELPRLEKAQVAGRVVTESAALRRWRAGRTTWPASDDPRFRRSAVPDSTLVAVVTPALDPFELAKAALENGKHVFVEKPFTSTPQQAEELIEVAARKNLKIMVDHTFLFSGAVRKIREIVDAGTLGPLYYFDSKRVNLGLFQHDVSVIWDLAPHDLSIMDYIVTERPEAVVATGGNHLNGHADMAFITIYLRAISLPRQRQLALPGENSHYADRWQRQDAGLERSRGDEKIQNLRQRRPNHQWRGASTTYG